MQQTRTVTGGLIGALAFVEITSGILQGYYVPLYSDIVHHLGLASDADFNIFEGAQLLLSSLVLPIMAKLGDMYGHRRILLISTAFTVLASWGIVASQGFVSFFLAWTLQGFYTVWLPLEIALIFDRARQTGRAAAQARSASAFLVVALESGAILGAVSSGIVFTAFGGDADLSAALTPTLAVPAVAVTLSFFSILFFVRESHPIPGRSLDGRGFVLLALALLFITSGLTFLKFNSVTTWWVWALIAAGAITLVPFGRHCLRTEDPAVDLRVFRQPSMWPIQLTAFLVGISLLGAQTPLSTFAGTDPEVNGFGLGLSAGQRSIIIGVYLLSMIAGALLFPVVSKLLSPRRAIIVAAFLVAIGYGLFLPFHHSIVEVFSNMVVAGLGSGVLMGAMPSSAAAAAPPGQTGVASAMTNTTKTIGGSLASSVFAIVLPIGAVQVAGNTAAGLPGYMIVWTICSVGALVAAILLFIVPKVAFLDAPAAADAFARQN